MTFKTYDEARNQIPEPARISCTFGFPGEETYDEAWHVEGDNRTWWIQKRNLPAEWAVVRTLKGQYC